MNPIERIMHSITVRGMLHVMAMKSPHDKMARSLYKLRGTKIGKNVYIDKDVYIEGFRPELITIEDNVEIGPRAVILAIDSSYNCASGHKYKPSYKKVRIKKNAYIGANAVILPGVTVGENSIVGAGSVVTKDVPPRTVVVGAPAKLIKSVDEKLRKMKYNRGDG